MAAAAFSLRDAFRCRRYTPDGREPARRFIMPDTPNKHDQKLGVELMRRYHHSFPNQVPNSKGRAVIHSLGRITARATDQLPPDSESQTNYRAPARRGPRSGQPGSPAIIPDGPTKIRAPVGIAYQPGWGWRSEGRQ